MALPEKSMLCKFKSVLLDWLIFSDRELSPFMEEYQILCYASGPTLWDICGPTVNINIVLHMQACYSEFPKTLFLLQTSKRY